MKRLLYLFFGLVSITYSHVLITPRPKPRDKCKSLSLSLTCVDKPGVCYIPAFCRVSLGISICDRGPEVFCATKRDAVKCDKEAFCLTWPDDSVVAVRIAGEPPNYDDPLPHSQV